MEEERTERREIRKLSIFKGNYLGNSNSIETTLNRDFSDKVENKHPDRIETHTYTVHNKYIYFDGNQP